MPHSGDASSLVSARIPLTHVTTTGRIESIITQGKILSIHNQEKKGILYNSQEANTDVLDRKYDFHKYVFSTLGRTSFHNGGNMALVFDPNDILNREGVVASLKEVADYGALVSKEAESIFIRTTGENPAHRNKKAIAQFFDNIIQGSDFERVFFSFLRQHFQNYADYLTTLVYPDEQLQTSLMGSMNLWGGPQIMIPRELSLSECKGILVRTHEECEHVMNLLTREGMQIPVDSLENYLLSSGFNKAVPAKLTSNFMKGMNLFIDDFFRKIQESKNI